MEEYIRLEEEIAQKHGKVFNWETAKYRKIWYDEDVHDLRSIETKFPAIFLNDELSSEKTLSRESTISSLNVEIDFRILFDYSDDEDYTGLEYSDQDIADFKERFAAGRKSEALISGGQFVARLTEHFGLLAKESLQGLMEVDAGRVIEEASVAPRGGDEDNEIAQAGQREVLDNMARDFSRFTTWTVTILARMMDRANVTYTSYSKSSIEYQRRNVGQRTNEPSTPTAL
nr:hypothetical protein [Tanacetum cinerariifolium]